MGIIRVNQLPPKDVTIYLKTTQDALNTVDILVRVGVTFLFSAPCLSITLCQRELKVVQHRINKRSITLFPERQYWPSQQG